MICNVNDSGWARNRVKVRPVTLGEKKKKDLIDLTEKINVICKE